MQNNAQKICLVTGANSGIGKEITIGLARAGLHVIMVCRDLKRGEAALLEIKKATGANSIDLLIADLSSQNEIHKLADTINKNYPHLDILINNAALVLPKKIFSVDGIEMTLATNHLAPFLLTNLLLNSLQKSTSARIINISSDIYKWAKLDLNDLQYAKRKYRAMKAYAQSKLLLNIVSFELARRLKSTKVTINCIHPGAVRTKLGSNHGTNNFALKLIDKIIKSFFMTSEKAAKNPLYLALSADVAGISGQYFIKSNTASPKLLTYDAHLVKKVWEISESLVHQNFG